MATVYSVVTGDTLSGIAKKYGVKSDDIVALAINSDINTLDGKGIIQVSIPQNGGSPISYKVVAGDSLSSLAAKNRTTVEAILGLPDNNNLNSQSVKISSGKVTIPPPSVIYTIVAGDTIQSVATAFGTTIGAICDVAINSDIVATLKLTPGNLITVPTAAGNKIVTIAAGQTISSLAADNKTTVGAILNCKNPQGNLNNADVIGTISLTPGNKITMPSGVMRVSQPSNTGGSSGTVSTTNSAPVRLNQVLTTGRLTSYESSNTPSHTLPKNFLAKYPTPASQPGPEPRIFNIKGECAWYAAVVCYYELDNQAPIRWGGEAGTFSQNGQNVTIYKGDGGNWPNLVNATPGAGSLTDTPEVGCLVTFDRSNSNPWGHISVVEDIRSGKDSAGNDVIVVSISEYNRNLDQKGGYRDIAFPARSGALVNPGGIHFIKMTRGFRYS